MLESGSRQVIPYGGPEHLPGGVLGECFPPAAWAKEAAVPCPELDGCDGLELVLHLGGSVLLSVLGDEPLGDSLAGHGLGLFPLDGIAECVKTAVNSVKLCLHDR